MSNSLFSDNLKTLESIEHIAEIQLLDADGNLVAAIPNQPGKQGSLAVYATLAKKYGAMNKKAAQEGLILFAEHTQDAQNHPGKHPNIDRLFDIIDKDKPLTVKLIEKL